MKKKSIKGMRLVRPADGFLPLALIVTSVLGRSTASEKLFMCALFPALFDLASARGLRIAFSEQPSMRKVAGSVKLALLLQFVGAFAFLVVDLIRNHGQFVMTNMVYICAGMLLNIEHVFYEYLYATGDNTSAAFVTTDGPIATTAFASFSAHFSSDRNSSTNMNVLSRASSSAFTPLSSPLKSSATTGYSSFISSMYSSTSSTF